MEKTLVFIDAGFLSKVNKEFGGGIPNKFDILKFVKQITGKENLIFNHLFYYTAPPFQSNNPSNDEKKRRERYDKFIENLRQSNEITIREGRCQRLRVDGQFIFKQKGVDTFVIMDLMEIPIKYPKIKSIILIASDSDFVPIIQKLRSYGIEIILYTYFDKKRNSFFLPQTNC